MRKTLTIEQLLEVIKASTQKRQEQGFMDKMSPCLVEDLEGTLRAKMASKKPLPECITKFVKNGEIDKEIPLNLAWQKTTIDMPGIGSVTSTSIFNKSTGKRNYLSYLASDEDDIEEGIKLYLDDYVDIEDEEGGDMYEEDVIDTISESDIFKIPKWE